MILKGSQRGGGKQMGLHLLKTEENEHVAVHEVSGFVADDVMGAMKEAHALAKGTKCRQYLFSVSLSPPESESVRVEVFEGAIASIEKKLGLEGQPRVVVFHEKEGRRHAHCVWSRIDADTMTAKQMSLFKTKLGEVSKQLYLENGWAIPEGFRDARLKDPRNFTLAEWQQAKRAGIDPREVKSAILESWSTSDTGPAFAKALEERGLFLARGDRGGHIALTLEGEAFAISRVTGKRQKEVAAKFGDPQQLRGAADTMRHIGETVGPQLSRYITEAKRIAHNTMRPLTERKVTMKEQHQAERKTLAEKQHERHLSEQAERSGRLRKGIAGTWDILTGRYFRVRKQNEAEAFFAMERDRTQSHNLISAQLRERQSLQRDIEQAREREARQMLGLYQNAARYRRMTREGELTRDGSERGRDRGANARGLELGR